jgi:hypothetical protein
MNLDSSSWLHLLQAESDTSHVTEPLTSPDVLVARARGDGGGGGGEGRGAGRGGGGVLGAREDPRCSDGSAGVSGCASAGAFTQNQIRPKGGLSFALVRYVGGRGYRGDLSVCVCVCVCVFVLYVCTCI